MTHARIPHRRPNPPAEGEQLTARTITASLLAVIVTACTPTPAVAFADGAPPSARAQIIAAAAVSPWPVFSACVEHRESRGDPTARSSTSSSQGLFQFLDRQWRRGLAYMVRDRLVHFGMTLRAARAIRQRLQRIEIADWPERMQRVGHAEVLHRGGWRHWSLTGSPCNRLVGR